MKILITGISGFIGSNLQKKFQLTGHDVVGYVRDRDLGQQLNHVVPDLIINCAAEIYNQDFMWQSNVVLVKTLLDWIKINPKTSMIQLGSSSEYGVVNEPTNENHAIVPQDMYAGTKGAATLLCQSYSNSFDLDITVVRPYSPYGPGEKSHRLFPKLWQSFCLNRPMDLVNGVHDFLYIDDLVDAIYRISQHSRQSKGGIVNISSGQQTSNLEVLSIFQQVTGKSGNVCLVDKFVTPEIWCADISFARASFNWQPKISLEQGIKMFIDQGHYE